MYDRLFSEWVASPHLFKDALLKDDGPCAALWLMSTWIERLQQKDRPTGTMPMEWIEAIVDSTVRPRLVSSGIWNEIQNVAYLAMEMETLPRKQALWGDLVEGFQRNADVLNAHEYMMLVAFVSHRIEGLRAQTGLDQDAHSSLSTP